MADSVRRTEPLRHGQPRRREHTRSLRHGADIGRRRFARLEDAARRLRRARGRALLEQGDGHTLGLVQRAPAHEPRTGGRRVRHADEPAAPERAGLGARARIPAAEDNGERAR